MSRMVISRDTPSNIPHGSQNNEFSSCIFIQDLLHAKCRGTPVQAVPQISIQKVFVWVARKVLTHPPATHVPSLSAGARVSD